MTGVEARTARLYDFDQSDLTGTTQSMIAVLLPEAIRLYHDPRFHGEYPEAPEDLASYIMEYPQFVTEHYYASAYHLASSREATTEDEVFTLPYAQLAASVMRIMLTDEELYEIAGQPYDGPDQE